MTFFGESSYYNKAFNGKAYIISEVENVASGGTFNLHLKNPSFILRRLKVKNK